MITGAQLDRSAALLMSRLSLAEEQSEVTRNGLESKELVYLVHIYCQGRSWMVRRSYEDFRVLDKHLHLCIYDRRFSQLPELPRYDSLRERAELYKIFESP
ncbi:rho GTPase-activating protein 32 isoform X1 [Tachysurus ichikawai]